jgi:hypothetical protein
MILYRRHGRFDLEDKLFQGSFACACARRLGNEKDNQCRSLFRCDVWVTEIEGEPTLEEQDVPYRAARTARCFRSIAAVCVSRVVVVATMRRHLGKECREAFTCLRPFWISTNLHMHLPLDSLRYFLFDQSALPQFAGQSSNPNTDGWVRRTIKLSLPRILAVTD